MEIGTNSTVVAGIDPAWSSRNPSAVAVLRLSTHQQPTLTGWGRSLAEYANATTLQLDFTTAPTADANFIGLKQLAKTPKLHIVAIDMPIIKTPSQLLPTGHLPRRTADNQIAQQFSHKKIAAHSPGVASEGIRVFNRAMFKYFAPLGFEPCQQPSKLRGKWFETYPHLIITEGFGLSQRLQYKVSRAGGSKGHYWPTLTPTQRRDRLTENLLWLTHKLTAQIKGLDALLPNVKTITTLPMVRLKNYEDLLDALLCAVMAAYALQNQPAYVGNPEGYIFYPDKAFM